MRSLSLIVCALALMIACSDRRDRLADRGRGVDGSWSSDTDGGSRDNDVGVLNDDAGVKNDDAATGDASIPVTEHPGIMFADFLVTKSELDETETLEVQALFIENDSVHITGGALVEAQQQIVLGTFSGANENWSIRISVQAINANLSVDTPAGGGTQNLRARFFLSDGMRIERDFVVRIVCSADPQRALCGAACTNVEADRQHCGGCAVACEGPRPSCQGGVCYPCPVSQILCEGVCVSPKYDDNHCGGCGIVCSGEGAKCDDGTCTACKSNERFCQGQCIDVQSNVAQCGACGNQCPGPDAACTDGACATCASEPHKTACNSSWCTDLSLDKSNCGMCGHSCSDYDFGAPYRNECVAAKCQAEYRSTAGTSFHRTCREICSGRGMTCGKKVFPADYRCDAIGPAAGYQRYRTHSGTSVYQCIALGCDTQPVSTHLKTDPLTVCLCEAGPS